MSLIETYDDLLVNQRELAAARSNAKLRANYVDLVRKGKVLLPYLHGGRLLFGPSRFLGYRGNTIPQHINHPPEGRDGKLTNPQITRILRAEFGFPYAPSLTH